MNKTVKLSNIKHTTEQEQRVIDLAMDYSERVRSYGNKTKLVRVEDYLKRLPKECHERFLELVNLDALAGSLKGVSALGALPLRHESTQRVARPS